MNSLVHCIVVVYLDNESVVVDELISDSIVSTTPIIFASRYHSCWHKSSDSKEQFAQHLIIYFNIIMSKMRNFNC